MNDIVNPFNITKADDFSDQQIKDYWVDVPGTNFSHLFKPTSPMPMLIYGGKGSGKTHLMRYFSLQLQKIRYGADITNGIMNDKYIGIYLRCGGLNASRFNGKGQSDEVWAAVFAYYMELWLSQLILNNLQNAFLGAHELNDCSNQICEEILSLFDDIDFERPRSLNDFSKTLAQLQKKADFSINNSAITRNLDDLKIHITAPNLFFGIPKVLTKHLSFLKHVQFIFLLDEMENLLDLHQKYIFTLVRERKSPCTFKFGSRLYGIKTFETFSAGEELKEGSDYEKLHLDAQFRADKKYYPMFAKKLCVRRLIESGLSMPPKRDDTLLKTLNGYFEEYRKEPFHTEETNFVIEKYRDRPRPYFEILRTKLIEGISFNKPKGITSEDDIAKVLLALSLPDYPLLEKLNAFLFYKYWHENRMNLIDAANEISDYCKAFVVNPKIRNKYSQTLDHFKSDLIAQLLRDCDRKQIYIGLNTLIDMSSGLPRNFLIILKHIYKWALFREENPFKEKPISINSQQNGIKEASDWFFQDAQITGREGATIQKSIIRLATLFRALRFSDKPVECSLSSFSVDDTKISKNARNVIQSAEKWSLLIRISGGQRDRNTKQVNVKYQLNSMLSPTWDLSIYRRGTIALTPIEVDSIFDPDYEDKFEENLKTRVARMTAPFFGKPKSGENKKVENKKGLFDV